MAHFRIKQLCGVVLCFILLSGCAENQSNSSEEVSHASASPVSTAASTPATNSEKTLNNLVEKHQAKNMLTASNLRYTFQLADAVVGKNIVTRAELYDIAKKDENTYILYLQQGWEPAASSPVTYYQLEYPAEKAGALLTQLSDSKSSDTFAIAAQVSQISKMKLDITATYNKPIEPEEDGEVLVEENPSRFNLIKGTCLEIIPVKSRMDELWESL